MQRRVFLVGAIASVLGPACNRQPKTVPHLIGRLRHPDPDEREDAADDLRMDFGIPAEAIGPLLEAIAVERDPDAHGAMLVTLGKSGVPEAKRHIDGAIPVPDKDVREYAAEALKNWFIATGRMHPKQKLPRYWPYGQPGYPPPLQSQIDDDD